jgi:KaiC/GvpD/RAD55 family RecA-like ATPase
MLPPITHIAAVAKHGSDEDFLNIRNDVRWLALWIDEFRNDLVAHHERLVVDKISDNESDLQQRQVTLTMTLSEEQLLNLLELLFTND